MSSRENNKILTLHVDIDNLLKDFKQNRCVNKATRLSVCFQHLKDLVGNKILQLCQEHLHTVIGEDAPQDAAKEAVEKFKQCLEDAVNI